MRPVSVSFTMVNSLLSESEFRVAQSILPWEEEAAKRLQREDLPRLPDGCGLTVMFPAYNDAHTIGVLVDYSAKILPRVTSDFEIVVVNDGSPDATGEVLAQRQALYPFLRVVTHTVNQGYGAALRSGFEAATKSHVFYTDGDGQYDPTELTALIPPLGENGMVNGYKLYRGDGKLRHVVGRVYHHTARFLFGLPIHDTDCDFRLIRRDVLTSLHLTSNSGSICCELVWQMKNSKMPLAEVGVHHYPRVSGTSQFFKVSKIVASLQKLLQLWWRLVLSPFGGRILRTLGLRK